MPGPAAGLTLDPLSAEWAIAAGGYRFVGGALRTTADAPVYFKAADQWYARTMPGGSRAWHASLATSTGVTFFGGERNDGTYSVLSSVVRYNSGVDTFSTLTSLPVARTKAGAAHLSTATALVAAGEGANGAAIVETNKASLPATSPWSQAAVLGGPAVRATVTATGVGAVVAGGYAGAQVLRTTNLFRTADTAAYGAALAFARYAHTATLLTSGRVFLAGGVGESGVATDSAELVDDTTCNEGSHRAPVEAAWSNLAPGLYDSSHVATIQVENTTEVPVEAAVSVWAEGLDGRVATRQIWTGPIAANTTAEVPFALSGLPVQSVGRKSRARLHAQVVASPDSPHLVGVTAKSQTLATTFDPNYTQVTTYSDDESESSVLEGVASLSDIAARIGALGVALSSSAGRVWNGSAFDDVLGLGPNFEESATALGGHVFSSADAALFDIYPAPTSPWGSDASGIRVCPKFLTTLIDDGRGEPVVLGNAPVAAHLRLELYEIEPNGAGTLLWAGNANESGCTPRLQAVAPGHGYLLKAESRLRLESRNVDVEIKAPPRGPNGQEMTGNGPDGFGRVVSARGFSLASTPFGTDTVHVKFTTARAFDAALAVSHVLTREAEGIPMGKTFTVMLDRCNGAAPSTKTYTACASPEVGVLWLGSNARAFPPHNQSDAKVSHNVDWKFVVSHEFGHLIVGAQAANPSHDYDALTGIDMCKCNHILATEDQSHCLQSKEYYGGVEVESLAHAIAADTWNMPLQPSCTFVYYKDVLNGDLANPKKMAPPFPVSCASPVQWLKTFCEESGTGVEWDWMNWFRDLSSAAPPENISQVEISDIFVRACGGGTCVGKVPTVEQLIAAANVKFGVNSPQAIRFRTSSTSFGVRL